MTLPNTIIAGAPRCGTSSLFATLAYHPQVCSADRKELHYFDQHHGQGDLWYAKHFSHCTAETVILEKTAGYFFRTGVVQRLRNTLPNTRLLFLLRNPVDRALSHYYTLQTHNKIPSELPFEQAIVNYPELLAIGHYIRHLERFHEHFSDSQISIWLFEEMLANPADFYSQLFEALGIDPYPAILTKMVDRNQASSRRKRSWKTLLGLAHDPTGYPAMEIATRKQLNAYFSESIKRLTQRYGINLSCWQDDGVS